MLRRSARLALIAAVLAAGCGGGDGDRAAGSQEGWVTLAPSALSRTEVAAARVGRFVYVMGGFEQRSGRTTAATERYDIERDRWTRVADMPVALNHAAAAAYRGRVYVLGGYRGAGGLTDEVATLYRYAPARDRWRRLPSAPTRRGALAVGVIGHRLYAVGGASAARGALPTLEIYDFRRRRWRSGPPMRLAREHLAAAVAGGRLYALAGRAAGQGNFSAVQAYDPRARRWLDAPPMGKPRGGIGAASVGGRIVVVGGEEDAGTIREVELYDPEARRWTRMADLPTPRHGLGVVARRGRVYAIAGGDTPGFAFTSAVEALHCAGALTRRARPRSARLAARERSSLRVARGLDLRAPARVEQVRADRHDRAGVGRDDPDARAAPPQQQGLRRRGRARERAHRAEPVGAQPRGGGRVEAQHPVAARDGRGVEVGGAPDPAVDVGPAADLDRREHPRHRARGEHRIGHAGRGSAGRAEQHAPARVEVDCGDPQAPVEARVHALERRSELRDLARRPAPAPQHRAPQRRARRREPGRRDRQDRRGDCAREPAGGAQRRRDGGRAGACRAVVRRVAACWAPPPPAAAPAAAADSAPAAAAAASHAPATPAAASGRRPAASAAATMAPADVPTNAPASRRSHPASASRPASSARIQASPSTPPPPSTSTFGRSTRTTVAWRSCT